MKRVLMIFTIVVYNSVLYSCSEIETFDEQEIEKLITEGEDGSSSEESSEEDEG